MGQWLGVPDSEHECSMPMKFLRASGNVWRCDCGRAWQLRGAVSPKTGKPHRDFFRMFIYDRGQD